MMATESPRPKVDPKIVLRIQKLLALTHSGEIHEAQSASEKAAELMKKHGLSMKDVLAQQSSGIIELRVAGRKFLEVWRWGLFTACAWSVDAHTVRIESSEVIATILGTRDSTNAAKYLFDYFEKCLEDERHRLIKESELVGSTDLDSWRRGAVVAIQRRILTKKKQDGPAPELKQRALVIQRTEQEKIKDHVSQQFKTTYQPRMWSTQTNYSAYDRGSDFGRQIPMPDEVKKLLTKART